MLNFHRTYIPPFKQNITASVEDYFKRIPLYKRFMRFFGRYLYTSIVLKKSQKLEKITHAHKNILWMQWTDSYLGDSLMDLSSRVLLVDKKIDLLTKKNVATIYENDSVFNKTFIHPKMCNAKDYDLIIIDSYRERSVKIINQYFSGTACVTLYGYYNVNDFNRLYFSFYRINQLLLKPHSSQHILNIAKPLLSITLEDETKIKSYCLPNNFITIAIGGISKGRTFLQWGEVIDALFANKVVSHIVLIGLSDPQTNVASIVNKYSNKVIDMVGKVSFNKSAEIIKKSKLLICADGGLLHVANAVKTPVVGLFYYIDPKVRLIKINKSEALLDKNNINNIGVDEITKKTQLLIREI